MRATDIASGAPLWVYVLLIALVILGIRRLWTRELPIGVALLPSAAFLIWSLTGAAAFADRAGAVAAVAAWLIGAAAGAASAIVLPEPRGERLARRRVRLPGSRLPLFLYLGVFVVRFACGAWAAIHPEQATIANAIGIAVGAAATARLLIGIARWRVAPFSPVS